MRCTGSVRTTCRSSAAISVHAVDPRLRSRTSATRVPRGSWTASAVDNVVLPKDVWFRLVVHGYSEPIESQSRGCPQPLWSRALLHAPHRGSATERSFASALPSRAGIERTRSNCVRFQKCRKSEGSRMRVSGAPDSARAAVVESGREVERERGETAAARARASIATVGRAAGGRRTPSASGILEPEPRLDTPDRVEYRSAFRNRREPRREAHVSAAQQEPQANARVPCAEEDARRARGAAAPARQGAQAPVGDH